MRAQVAIIGAGPAGLFLALLLRRAGVDAVVLEKHTRAYVEGRVRAGVLESVTVDLMASLGVDARLREQGLVHRGVKLSVEGELSHIDLAGHTGRTITIYGQSEVMRDLNVAADCAGVAVQYEAADIELRGLDGDRPEIDWTAPDGERRTLKCDYVAGCDGFHGVCRASIPADRIKAFERVYPFGWLGVLAEAPPCAEELIYANHANGFALASMRSPRISRYYIQCAADTAIDEWSESRFWDELRLRLGEEAAAGVADGPTLEMGIAPLRSFVCEPMQWGRLFLAGDAAHIVPPTGAKGLNLAVSDVIFLADALIGALREGDVARLPLYSDRALARVWKAERFSWWFTMLTHRFPQMDGFDRKMQLAELDYIRTSRAAQAALAENYVGLPLTQ